MPSRLPDVDTVLHSLDRDRFRSSFRLGSREREILARKGLSAILEDARDFVEKRLAAGDPVNDGSQTPWRGHPVFVAQHATATCCRSCLRRWHRIEKGRSLDAAERDYIVRVIGAWLERIISDGETEGIADPANDEAAGGEQDITRSPPRDDQLELL